MRNLFRKTVYRLCFHLNEWSIFNLVDLQFRFFVFCIHIAEEYFGSAKAKRYLTWCVLAFVLSMHSMVISHEKVWYGRMVSVIYQCVPKGICWYIYTVNPIFHTYLNIQQNVHVVAVGDWLIFYLANMDPKLAANDEWLHARADLEF